jgi:hypothetical protein
MKIDNYFIINKLMTHIKTFLKVNIIKFANKHNMQLN